MAVIKRLGVMKTASFIALYSFFVGIIVSLIMAILNFISSGLLSAIGFSMIYLIALPFMAGISNFIFGLITVPIMNLVLKMIKGINLDIELSGQMY